MTEKAQAQIKSLIEDWVLTGWRHDARSERFSFRERLGCFYDWDATDGHFFDNADQENRVVRTVSEYGAIWDTMVPRLATLSNTMLNDPDVRVFGDIALVEVRFATRFEAKDGTVDEVPTLSSLALRRTDAGWKIFREHGTALVASNR